MADVAVDHDKMPLKIQAFIKLLLLWSQMPSFTVINTS